MRLKKLINNMSFKIYYSLVEISMDILLFNIVRIIFGFTLSTFLKTQNFDNVWAILVALIITLIITSYFRKSKELLSLFLLFVFFQQENINITRSMENSGAAEEPTPTNAKTQKVYNYVRREIGAPTVLASVNDELVEDPTNVKHYYTKVLGHMPEHHTVNRFPEVPDTNTDVDGIPQKAVKMLLPGSIECHYVVPADQNPELRYIWDLEQRIVVGFYQITKPGDIPEGMIQAFLKAAANNAPVRGFQQIPSVARRGIIVAMTANSVDTNYNQELEKSQLSGILDAEFSQIIVTFFKTQEYADSYAPCFGDTFKPNLGIATTDLASELRGNMRLSPEKHGLAVKDTYAIVSKHELKQLTVSTSLSLEDLRSWANTADMPSVPEIPQLDIHAAISENAKDIELLTDLMVQLNQKQAELQETFNQVHALTTERNISGRSKES